MFRQCLGPILSEINEKGLFMLVGRKRNTEIMKGNRQLLVGLTLEHQKFMNKAQELELRD